MKTKKLTIDAILKSIFQCPLNFHYYHVEVESPVISDNDYDFHVMHGSTYVFWFSLSEVKSYSIEEFDDFVYLKIKEYEKYKDLPY